MLTAILLVMCAGAASALEFGPTPPTSISSQTAASIGCATGANEVAIASNTLMVGCLLQRVGIVTGTPQTTLDVNGSASFGSGATKSTFSTTGALSLASGQGLTLSNGAAFAGAATFTSSVTLTASNPQLALNGGATGSPEIDLQQAGVNKAFVFYNNTTGNLIINQGGSTTGGIKVRSDDSIVLGPTQIGSGVTQSTFSATGSLTMDPAAKVLMGSRTKAQLRAITPVVGDMYYCSDCSDPTSAKATVVIATGTSAGNFGTLPVGAFQ